ncbi:MAG: 2-C-methyl-D-erythritol 2,4-cyclodiphosphate synthase [Verrucomicrobiales bacterium]|jgi:2-C-methyl-D-erythritol 2,4-cyclodiphosphate synthase|nr:2-C-methyl-D-erythritol 2,4-cyclodiphosphate synthase [Verrucomicrobiales bacterium]
MTRTGIGYDVHQLVTGRKLILGGVEIPHDRGLDGHSDADALIHAIADALLGAAGLEDIGFYFPNTDPRWKDQPSRVFLEQIRGLLHRQRAQIVNVDATLICEAPKIKPHIPAMKAAIAAALAVTPAQIGIKATTNETLGFVGRQEGIAAMAVANLEMAGGNISP